MKRKRPTLRLAVAKTAVWLREAEEARMKKLCSRLYDASTPEAERRDLSMEVAVLRQRLAGCKGDLLDRMTRASAEEEDGS